MSDQISGGPMRPHILIAYDRYNDSLRFKYIITPLDGYRTFAEFTSEFIEGARDCDIKELVGHAMLEAVRDLVKRKHRAGQQYE